MGRNTQNRKTWTQCQSFFEEACIARKRYIEAKASTKESINKVESNKWQVYIKALEAKATQDKKEQEEHVQQVTQQNTLIQMIQDQQRKIEELMATSNTLIHQIKGSNVTHEGKGKTEGETSTKEGKKKKLCINCKNWVYHNSNKCYTLETNKYNCPPWCSNNNNMKGSRKVGKPE